MTEADQDTQGGGSGCVIAALAVAALVLLSAGGAGLLFFTRARRIAEIEAQLAAEAKEKERRYLQREAQLALEGDPERSAEALRRGAGDPSRSARADGIRIVLLEGLLSGLNAALPLREDHDLAAFVEAAAEPLQQGQVQVSEVADGSDGPLVAADAAAVTGQASFADLLRFLTRLQTPDGPLLRVDRLEARRSEAGTAEVSLTVTRLARGELGPPVPTLAARLELREEELRSIQGRWRATLPSARIVSGLERVLRRMAYVRVDALVLDATDGLRLELSAADGVERDQTLARLLTELGAEPELMASLAPPQERPAAAGFSLHLPAADWTTSDPGAGPPTSKHDVPGLLRAARSFAEKPRPADRERGKDCLIQAARSGADVFGALAEEPLLSLCDDEKFAPLLWKAARAYRTAEPPELRRDVFSLQGEAGR